MLHLCCNQLHVDSFVLDRSKCKFGHWTSVENFPNQVSNNGWAEGECRGKAGWFPYDYIEKRERVLASKVAQVFWDAHRAIHTPVFVHCVLCPLSSEKICNFAENSLLDGFLPGRQHCLNPYGRNRTLMLIFILQLSRQYITIPFLFWTCNKISNQASTVLYHFTCLFKSYLWHAIWYSRAHLLLVQEVRSVI